MPVELRTLPELRARLAEWRRAGQSVALVPTMGALHAGHMALVAEAKRHAARVVVSIFVNPTQFGPNEDFHRYPRPLDDDLAQLRAAGADAAWLPDVATMYPQGFSTSIRVGGISEVLEGAFRPGHFDGVATVVAKLLHQVRPDIALFGEKDYQQLCLIRQLVRDLNIDTGIHAVPTLREADGLALSSRNRYLDADQRRVAATLHAAMRAVADAIAAGTPDGDALTQGRRMLVDAGFARLDYFELRHPETLAPTEEGHGRLLVAAWLGTTRLIDNLEIPPC